MSKTPTPLHSFQALEGIWYEKLKQDGFKDQESTSNPDRPLKEYHSLKFLSEKAKFKQDQAHRYFSEVENYNNYDEIYAICCLISKHGNSSVWPEDVQDIIDLHRDGLSERQIAQRVNRGKKCVHKTLKKVREWMRVV